MSSDKIQKPCYFYNTGGCYKADGTLKSADECLYLHVRVDEPMKKPQHLKPPCKYFHLRKHCNNPYCMFGHTDLPKDRWLKYFPTHAYPGLDYSKRYHCIWHNKSDNTHSSYFDINLFRASFLMILLRILDTKN